MRGQPTEKAHPELLARVRGLAESGDFALRPVRRLTRGGLAEGLQLRDNWTDIFEPVRRRHLLGNWHELQTWDAALLAIERFLVERPDTRS